MLPHAKFVSKLLDSFFRLETEESIPLEIGLVIWDNLVRPVDSAENEKATFWLETISTFAALDSILAADPFNAEALVKVLVITPTHSL